MEPSNTKLCPRCGQTLELAAFNFKHRATGRRQPYCRACSRLYIREHYERNKPYYIEKAVRRNRIQRRELMDRVLEYLLAHPCVDCGESDPVVLDFDHLDRSTKRWNIAARIGYGLGWRTIQAEIAKCVVRCANCHRRRTARQFGWYRLMAQPSRP